MALKSSLVIPAPKELLYVRTATNTCKIRLRIEGTPGPNLLKIGPITNYNTIVVVPFGLEKGRPVAEPTIWCQGAVHEISQPVGFAGYRFEPEPGASMTFKVDVEKGYVFQDGLGRVTTPTKEVIVLRDGMRGFIVGEPCQEPTGQRFEKTKAKAEKGDAKAQFNLGVMYYDGEGVDKDAAAAAKWFRSAGEQGLASAQFNLGLCFANGKGVDADCEQAWKWLSLASGQGNEDAKKNLAILETRMTREQIAEAQRLAREFKPHGTPEATASRSAADKEEAPGVREERLGTNVTARPFSEEREPSGVLPLHAAVRRGLVKVKTLNVRGSTGDVILLELQRLVPEVLTIQLAPGTVFSSTSGTVQNMVGATVKGESVTAQTYSPSPDIVLTDDRPHCYVVEAYCLDFDKDNPSDTDAFSVAPPDARTGRILAYAKTLQANINVVQTAIWLDRQPRLSDQDIKERFEASDADIASARAMLKNVSNTDLKAPSKVAEATNEANAARLPSPKPGHGHAKGVMLYNGSPTNGLPVYLHRVKPEHWTTEPVARTDKDGKWVALNVPAGRYISTSFRVATAGVYYTPSDVKEIKEGEVTDFGKENTSIRN
jgi:hypothetical protein